MDGQMDTVSLASFPDILISLVLLRCSIADAAALLTSVTPKQSRQTSLQWSLQLRYSSPWSSLPWWCQTSAVASESHTDNLDHSGLDSLSLLNACTVSLYVPDCCARFWIWYRKILDLVSSIVPQRTLGKFQFVVILLSLLGFRISC